MEKLINQTVYKCEICGRVYDKSDKAFKCEKSHVLELPVVELAETIGSLGRRPVFVTLKFYDGKMIIYKMLK